MQYPQKHRLTCVPVKKPCRPPRTGTTIRKVPSRTKPPRAQLPAPGVSQRPPGLPSQTPASAPRVSTRKEVPPTQLPAPPVTTRKEVPPQREALPGPPTGRPRLPDILPGPSEPMPEPGTPKRPTSPEGQRTTVPQTKFGQDTGQSSLHRPRREFQDPAQVLLHRRRRFQRLRPPPKHKSPESSRSRERAGSGHPVDLFIPGTMHAGSSWSRAGPNCFFR